MRWKIPANARRWPSKKAAAIRARLPAQTPGEASWGHQAAREDGQPLLRLGAVGYSRLAFRRDAIDACRRLEGAERPTRWAEGDCTGSEPHRPRSCFGGPWLWSVGRGGARPRTRAFRKRGSGSVSGSRLRSRNCSLVGTQGYCNRLQKPRVDWFPLGPEAPAGAVSMPDQLACEGASRERLLPGTESKGRGWKPRYIALARQRQRGAAPWGAMLAATTRLRPPELFLGRDSEVIAIDCKNLGCQRAPRGLLASGREAVVGRR